jgi:DTW domain-containing protein
MARVMCYRCFWPQQHCWCGSIRAAGTRARFVFLMHPKEFKEEKAGTGRLTHLSLRNSEIVMGKGFDEHWRVAELLADERYRAVLLYPGPRALDLTVAAPEEFRALFPNEEAADEKSLLIFVLDATWGGARKMLGLSKRLQALPRVMFRPSAPSRFVIKQQPHVGCLSTLEATHEVLLALDRIGYERYEDRAQLLDLFQRMQELQMRYAADPTRGGYRRQPYSDPATRLARLPRQRGDLKALR